MHEHLVVFDIETVIDTEAAARLLKIEGTPGELRQKLEEYHLDITKGQNAFPRQLFHKVVAISFLRAEIERIGGQEVYHLQEIRTGGTAESSEEELIKGFFNWCEKYKPRFVSFNGRTFDLPVLRYRAMKYGVSAPWFYNMGDKWNNYLQRYSIDWHADLLDMLSDFGASARIRLNEICALLSLPGKLDTDGGDVQALFDEGKIQDIRDYCETDVLNTWLVYLHVMRHRGHLDASAFDMIMDNSIEYLEAENKAHFREFLEAMEKPQANFV